MSAFDTYMNMACEFEKFDNQNYNGSWLGVSSDKNYDDYCTFVWF